MRVLARVAVFAAVALLSGCYFDQPLTGAPSKDINTWLLGVWESKDAEGKTSRVQVTPISRGRYFVQLALPGRNPKDVKKYEFEAWTSRVGDGNFLSLRCLVSPGDIPAGAHVFVHPQLLDQNHVRIRTLQLDSAPSATAFELRKEVRQKRKAGTLYNDAFSDWTRVKEVFWSTDGQDPTFTPLRSPTL